MIKLQNIKKSYKIEDQTLDILKGISLEIKQGEYVAIMGPSGSGKSTLMNILGMLDNPSEGFYFLDDIDVSKLSEDDLGIIRRDQIGFIFQQFHLLPRLTALENVTLPLLYSKKFKGSERAKDLLKNVDLDSRMHHLPKQLSGGQQQRVAIARSLINQPKILFADEPTGNLDTKSQDDIIDILNQLNSQGMTVIIVTHDEEVALHAHRIIKIRDGLIQSDEQNVQNQKIIDNRKLNVKSLFKIDKLKWSDFEEYFRQGFKTLAGNKIRTLLSMLGIMIGVASVVAMLALGQGAKQAIEDQMASMGSNLLMIRPGLVRVGGVAQESAATNRLSVEDIKAVKNHLSHVTMVSGQVSGRTQITSTSGKNWNTTTQGSSDDWVVIHNSSPVLGRFFTEEENQQRSRVAVIGETVRKQLFGSDINPIGELIKINKVIFQVIGVLPEKGANSFRDQDDIVIIPLETAMFRLFGHNSLDLLEVQVDRPDKIEQTQTDVLELLYNQHKIPYSAQGEAFQISNMAEMQKTIEQNNRTMSLLLSTIAAISLLVGGIGIMNIMLVSVTERTKEIGLRKSIGARRIDILAQFLSESVVVSVIGGFFGVVLGWLITLILSYGLGWSTSLSLGSIMISSSFSALIGIVFGVFPAHKASLLNPIDALRHD